MTNIFPSKTLDLCPCFSGNLKVFQKIQSRIFYPGIDFGKTCDMLRGTFERVMEVTLKWFAQGSPRLNHGGKCGY